MRRRTIAALWVLAAGALAACSSTQDVLEPSAIAPTSQGVTSSTPTAPNQPATASAAPVPSPAPAAQGKVQNAALIAAARIQFAPIVGTSVDAATALSERLAIRARERGMTLTGSTDTTTTHVLKGYFTPLTEGKQTTIIYVWDVYDPSGNRIHRISGQQKAPSKGGEGWQSVSPETMRTIADATIDQMAAWLSSRAG